MYTRCLCYCFCDLFYRYSVCIRQEEGFCCVQYLPCADIDSFTLDATGVPSIVDAACISDWITIPGLTNGYTLLDLHPKDNNNNFYLISGSADTCQQNNAPGIIRDRYCGNKLNVGNAQIVSIQICGKFNALS